MLVCVSSGNWKILSLSLSLTRTHTRIHTLTHILNPILKLDKFFVLVGKKILTCEEALNWGSCDLCRENKEIL